MTSFPSDEFFEALAAGPALDPDTYRRLGFAEFRLVIEVVEPAGARHFGLVLDGYDVAYAGELDDVGTFAPDAIVTGPLDVWVDMVENIATNGSADGSHTLNALSIAGIPLRVTSDDPMGSDKFFRYAETLQALFDGTPRAATAA